MESSLQWRAALTQGCRAEQGLLVIGIVILVGIFLTSLAHLPKYINPEKFFVTPFFRFIYASFLKPHSAKAGDGQQSALESFYSAQASVYDATRKRLLCGREDMLALVASQLQVRTSEVGGKPTWYDIGGGTGYNIEVMDKLVDIQEFFEHVYLVDLSPSLCQVACERVEKFKWKNVTILCQDARSVNGAAADLITMSYSLSMIPDFYSVIDLLTGMLKPKGIIGICDFYVQSIVDVSSRNYTGGVINRHVNWFGRMFWRTWFDADRVNLDAGRRDYLEYRFGTILSASERNYLLGGIPYYLFVGCQRDADTAGGKFHDNLEKLDAALTESPYLSPKDYKEKASQMVQNSFPRSKFYDSAIVNLTNNLPLPANFYQKHHWRIHYNDLLAKHQQFKDEYIYAFNWEDPKVDRQLLNITPDDVILTITSAGDNILDYLLESPARVHAVDLNPNQNHLLELKCAAFTALPHRDCWALFAEGTHPDFRGLLINKLSPHMSSHAFQYWLSHTSTFSPSRGGLYTTGGSRHAINMMRWLFKIFNLTTKVRTFCSVETLNEQREIWPAIREILLSWPLHWAIVSTEFWSWKAAGVPREQRALILDDYKRELNAGNAGGRQKKEVSGEAVWKYMVDTLDPVAEHTQISRDNYFYYVCMQGKYSKNCHPRYLGARAHAKLNRPSAFDGLRIHTDEIMEVISRMAPDSLTIAILMDSMDWFTPPETAHPSTPHLKPVEPGHPTLNDKIQSSEDHKSSSTSNKSTLGPLAALNQILALRRVLKPGGKVLFRSASVRPWYADTFEKNGFEVRCVAERRNGRCVDRVNMYAGTYICVKLDNDGKIPLKREDLGSLSPKWRRNRKSGGRSWSSGSSDNGFDDGDESRGRELAGKKLLDLDLGPPSVAH